MSTLLITGLSLDKRDFTKVEKEISKDRDLIKFLRPIRLFYVAWVKSWLKFAFPLVVALLDIFIESSHGYNSISEFFELPIGEVFFRVTVLLAVIGFEVFHVHELIKDKYMNSRIKREGIIKNKGDEKKKSASGKSFLFFSKIKKPFDIWNLYLSNTSDAQTAIPFLKKNNSKETFLYFTGKPYYTVKFIDSIYMELSYGHTNSIDLSKLAKKIKKRLIDVKSHDFINYFLKVTNEEERNRDVKNLFSGYVFGIHFLSKFFYMLKNNYHQYFEQYFENKKVHFEIQVPKDIKTNLNLSYSEKDKNDNEYYYCEAIKQAIDLSTNSRDFYWNKDNGEDEIKIKLYMTEVGTKSYDYSFIRKRRYKKFNAIFSNKELYNKLSENKKQKIADYLKYTHIPGKTYVRIPFKRPIAVPCHENSGEYTEYDASKSSRFLPYQVERELAEGGNVFFVGGAEHNLALLCVMREFRVQYFKSKKTDSSQRFGVVENAFDYTAAINGEPTKSRCPILISCEKLVQSFYRMNEEPAKISFSYGGEICRIGFDKEIESADQKEDKSINCYFFFGYSAPMTKIISAFLAKEPSYYIKKLSDKDTAAKRIILLLYNGNKNKDFGVYNWDEMALWDKYDFINNGNLLECENKSSNSYRLFLKNNDKIGELVLIDCPPEQLEKTLVEEKNSDIIINVDISTNTKYLDFLKSSPFGQNRLIDL